MLAGDESTLAVAGVAVGVVGGLTEDADPPGLLVPAHDAVIGNVAPQETARITEIDRALVKATAGCEALDAGKREPVFVEGRIETLYRGVGIALAWLPGRQCRRRESHCGRCTRASHHVTAGIFHGGF